jgi:hypothetical protein
VDDAADRFVITVAPQNYVLPPPTKKIPSVFVNLAFSLWLRISKNRDK